MHIANNAFLGYDQVTKAIDGSKISLTTYADNKEFEELHSHENCSISLLIEGSYKEDLHLEQFSRVPGNIKFVRSGELHRCYAYTSDAKNINLEFNKEQLKAFDITEDQIFNLVLCSPHTKFNLIRLYKELAFNFNEPPALASIILYELFDKTSSFNNYKIQPTWVKKLIEILNDEWEQSFTLNDLSGVLGVHPVTISKLFPHYFSSTLSRYVQKIKVEKALSMIKSSALSLTEISYKCGFADQGHFTRTFKDITGFLPKDFRKI
jgi:AraC family transcriptional regulator